MNPDCLPCAGASRPTIKRPVGRTVCLEMKVFENSDNSTPAMGKQLQIIIFPGSHWAAAMALGLYLRL